MRSILFLRNAVLHRLENGIQKASFIRLQSLIYTFIYGLQSTIKAARNFDDGASSISQYESSTRRPADQGLSRTNLMANSPSFRLESPSPSSATHLENKLINS